MFDEEDEAREHIAAMLDVAVRSGYGTKAQLREELVDMISEELAGSDASTVAAEVARFLAEFEQAWAEQLELETHWEPVTLNDHIDAAFDELEQRGIVALQDAGYTMTDGWEVIRRAAEQSEGAWGGVFFHRQDVEFAVNGAGLMLAFGAFADGAEHEPESLRLGREVCEVLASHGVATEWDGTLRQRIAIPPFAWRKRRRD